MEDSTINPLHDANKSTRIWSPPPPQIIARRIRNAAAMQAARARESPESQALRKETNAARMEVFRASLSPEKAAEARAKNAIAMKIARARETPEQTAIRRAQNAARMGALRAKETAEQRDARRAQNAARMQAARAKESLKGRASSTEPASGNCCIPLKKRREEGFMIYDMDQQERKKREALVNSLAVIPTQLAPKREFQSDDESSKFSFEVD